MLTKMCCNCKKIKNANEFGKDKRTPTGLKSRCLDCEREYSKQYYWVNKEYINSYSKNYHRENSEVIRKRKKQYWIDNRDILLEKGNKYRKSHLAEHAAKMRKYRKEKPQYNERNKEYRFNHPEKYKESSRKNYQNHKDARLEYAKQYRIDNLGRILQWNRNREARQKSIPGEYTEQQWNTLCSFFNGICPCCNEEKTLTADHIIPVSWPNSTNFITNIQPLCLSCNCSKNNNNDNDYRPNFVKEWAKGQVDANSNSSNALS